MVLSKEDIISYINLLFVWSCPKKILSHTEIYCFYYLVPIRYYLIQKTINTNSRVHEVEWLSPASSYKRHRISMYELAGDFTKK